jgi:hypothetical protein
MDEKSPNLVTLTETENLGLLSLDQDVSKKDVGSRWVIPVDQNQGDQIGRIFDN